MSRSTRNRSKDNDYIPARIGQRQSRYGRNSSNSALIAESVDNETRPSSSAGSMFSFRTKSRKKKSRDGEKSLAIVVANPRRDSSDRNERRSRSRGRPRSQSCHDENLGKNNKLYNEDRYDSCIHDYKKTRDDLRDKKCNYDEPDKKYTSQEKRHGTRSPSPSKKIIKKNTPRSHSPSKTPKKMDKHTSSEYDSNLRVGSSGTKSPHSFAIGAPRSNMSSASPNSRFKNKPNSERKNGKKKKIYKNDKKTAEKILLKQHSPSRSFQRRNEGKLAFRSNKHRTSVDEVQLKSSLRTYSESEETTKCDKDDYVNAEISYNEFGNAQDVMQYLGYLDNPLPKYANSVIIKVEASTVSMTDVLMRKNLWHEAVRIPNTPGVDCVGRIFSAGDDISKYGLKKGDRVAALSQFLGGNARYVSFSAENVVKIPEKVDAAQAACVQRTYLTAYQCLHRAGEKPVQPGDSVLVIGGNGAVAQAVIQLALVAGASRVFATVHNKYRDLVQGLGAIPLPREPEDWLPEVEGQMDIIVDGVCADGFSSSHAALRCKYSKLVCIGTTANSKDEQIILGVPVASMWRLTQAAWLMSQTTFFDVFKYNNENPENFKEDLLCLYQLLRDGWIIPEVENRIPLKEVPNAHDLVECGGLTGHIVCIPWLGVYPNTRQQVSGSSPPNRARPSSPSYKNKSRKSTPVAWKVSEYVQNNYDSKMNKSGLRDDNDKREESPRYILPKKKDRVKKGRFNSKSEVDQRKLRPSLKSSSYDSSCSLSPNQTIKQKKNKKGAYDDLSLFGTSTLDNGTSISQSGSYYSV